MSASTSAAADERRKAVITAYFEAFDNGGTNLDGTPVLDYFADDAVFFFPKWGVARGRAEIGEMFGDLGGAMRSIVHHIDSFTWVMSGTDVFAVEGTTHGEHRDGPWEVGRPAWGAGRWCGVFEVRDDLVHRAFLYLDPDYANKDTDRYSWLAARAQRTLSSTT